MAPPTVRTPHVVTAIAKTLELCKGKRLLILSDSQAAIAALVKAGEKGQGRTKELRAAVNEMQEGPYSGMPRVSGKPHWH